MNPDLVKSFNSPLPDPGGKHYANMCLVESTKGSRNFFLMAVLLMKKIFFSDGEVTTANKLGGGGGLEED